MRVDDTDGPQFRVGNTGQVGEIPAFRFPKWQDLWGGFGGNAAMPPTELLLNLPAPGEPFGLSHLHSRIPHNWFREIARFKNLHALDVSTGRTPQDVTDLDAGHIAALSGLRVLGLQNTAITDESFLRLVGHSQLRVLKIPDAQVTDNGFK